MDDEDDEDDALDDEAAASTPFFTSVPAAESASSAWTSCASTCRTTPAASVAPCAESERNCTATTRATATRSTTNTAVITRKAGRRRGAAGVCTCTSCMSPLVAPPLPPQNERDARREKGKRLVSQVNAPYVRTKRAVWGRYSHKAHGAKAKEEAPPSGSAPSLPCIQTRAAALVLRRRVATWSRRQSSSPRQPRRPARRRRCRSCRPSPPCARQRQNRRWLSSCRRPTRGWSCSCRTVLHP